MRMIVYIDGHNLFYSLLKKTPFKWLNLNRLFSRVIRPIEPSSEITRTKYFTTSILGSLADDSGAEQRQAHYYRALKAAGGIEIIKGFPTKATTTGILVDHSPERHIWTAAPGSGHGGEANGREYRATHVPRCDLLCL